MKGKTQMNTWTKSLATLAFLTGTAFSAGPSFAEPATTFPAPAPAQAALTALLAQPASSLPPGTKLLSVKITDGLATVSFSHELRDNFTGGDTAETRAVNSVLRTLGQFPTVTRAQMLVEGRPIDSLGGLLILSEPLPVIRPADDAAASAQTGRRWLHRKPHIAARKAQM